jgi:chromosome partitioning protein
MRRNLASSYVLVPVKPEYLSAIGLPLLRQSLGDFRADNTGHSVRVAGIVFNSATEYEPEELRSKNEVRALAKQFGWKVFNHQVPYSRSFPKGAREGQPIFWTSYARSKPKQRVQGFAAELADAVGVK